MYSTMPVPAAAARTWVKNYCPEKVPQNLPINKWQGVKPSDAI